MLVEMRRRLRHKGGGFLYSIQMVEAPDIVERGRYLLTINIRLKVGKRNDRSGKTAAGHSRPSMWQRALPTLSAWPCGTPWEAHEGTRLRWPSQSPSRSVHPGDLSRDHASPLHAAAPWRERDLHPLFAISCPLCLYEWRRLG